jgi:hypothetical protein
VERTVMSLASLTIPTGITSRKLSKLKSIRPSRLMTSCLLAKNRAMMIPTKLPRPNISPVLRLLLFLVVNPFSLDTGINCTSSPSREIRSPGPGDGDGVCRKALPIRRRRADMSLATPIGDASDRMWCRPCQVCLRMHMYVFFAVVS